jgi:hypothetical protein
MDNLKSEADRHDSVKHKNKQEYRTKIARGKAEEETVRARELRAERKRVRNAETAASLNRRKDKLARRAGGNALSGPGPLGNMPDMDASMNGAMKGLDDIDKRLRGLL